MMELEYETCHSDVTSNSDDENDSSKGCRTDSGVSLSRNQEEFSGKSLTKSKSKETQSQKSSMEKFQVKLNV